MHALIGTRGTLHGSTPSACMAAPVTDLEFPSGIEAAPCYNIFQQ